MLVTHLKRSKGRTCHRHRDQVHPETPERCLRHRRRAQQPPRLRQLQDLRVRTFSRGRCGHHGVPRRVPAPSRRLLYARARKPAVQEHHPHECERGGAGRKRHPGWRVEATAPSHCKQAGRPERFLPERPVVCAPIPRCAQISGGPARNRVVFINGRRLKGVVRTLREKPRAACRHRARSTMPDSQTPSLTSRAYRPS